MVKTFFAKKKARKYFSELTDEYIDYHFANLNIAKHILIVINKNNLLEVWQAEKKARDIELEKSKHEFPSF